MPIVTTDVDVNLAAIRTPGLGFGTFMLQGADCEEGVADALAIGYRFIDTAEGYKNETQVGNAIARSSVPRDDIFLCTKISPERTADEAVVAIQAALERLQTDYVDLLLLHWPNLTVPNAESLAGIATMVERGHVRNMGVSNFTTALIAEVIDDFPIRVNQVEYHPFLSQRKLLAQAEQLGLGVHAYAPLAKGTVADDATLIEIGNAHGKLPSQVALRWLVQQPNVGAIPKSATASRRKDNFAIFDFELSDDELAAIDALGSSAGRIVNPERAPHWDVDEE